MQSDRIRRFVRGMSAAAGSSVLVLAALGPASAHPLSITSSNDAEAGREALIALISRHEPFEDAASIEALADRILIVWPDIAAVALGLLDDDHEEEADDEPEPSDDADEDDAAEDEDDEAHDEDEDESEESHDEDEDESDESEGDDDEDEDEDESEDESEDEDDSDDPDESDEDEDEDD